MAIILVSDIFGKTPALTKLAKALNAEAIIDPYNGEDMSFDNESDAYDYFTKQVGLDTYFTLLNKAVSAFYSTKTLIGFSVGASAIWALSEKESSHKVNNAVCYYGSQIRNHTEINPLFPIEMIFPKYEAHFDVTALQKKLATKTQVKIIKTDYLHGFMNYHSSNYNHNAYLEHLNMLRVLLR